MDRLSRLNPQSLIVFYHVAKEKNMTSAADKLCLTQPGIAYHMRLLEKYLSVKLLNFQKNQAVLTPAGEGVFKYAESIYKQIEDIEKFIQSLTDLRLNIGLEGIFMPVMAPILSQFEKQYPQVKLIVNSDGNTAVLKGLLESKFDIGVVHQIDFGEESLKRLLPDSSRKLVCFASKDTQLPNEPVGWEELCRYPFVMGIEGSSIRKVIENKFLEKGLPIPRFTAEVNHTEWHKRFVANGIGLSFILSEDIEKEVSQGLLKIVSLKEDLFIPIRVVIRSDTVLNQTIQNFVSILKTELS